MQVHPDHTSDTVARGATVVIHALTCDGGTWLATHPRAGLRDSWVIDPAHWDGLPDGHTRATTIEAPGPDTPAPAPVPMAAATVATAGLEPLTEVLRRHHADMPVLTRPLADYAHAAAPITAPMAGPITGQIAGPR